MTVGRRRARAAGPMRTCCPISNAAKPGSAAKTPGVAAPARSAPNSQRRPIRCLTPGWKRGRRSACLRPRTTTGPSRKVSAAASTPSATAGAHATQVLMQGTRASGVEYLKKNGEKVRAEADRDVVLASGTFNSPQLLMLSGVGPAAHLAAMGIKTVIDLPVGKNLQDHLGAYMTYTRPNPGAFHREMRFDRMATSMIRSEE